MLRRQKINSMGSLGTKICSSSIPLSVIWKAENTSILSEFTARGGRQGASSQTLNLSVGGIQAHLLSGEEGQRVVARYKEANRLELSFRPTKPLVPFGDRGLSRKGSRTPPRSAVLVLYTLTGRGHPH